MNPFRQKATRAVQQVSGSTAFFREENPVRRRPKTIWPFDVVKTIDPFALVDGHPISIASERVRILDDARVRRDGDQIRIAIPMANGEPCEMIPVKIGGYTMFYLCCGGHCAPMPIVVKQPAGTVARALGLTTQTSGANCWIGLGYNNVVTLCCEVANEDVHCIPLPITFGPVPQGNPATTRPSRIPFRRSR
jgi:hypothetical protein